MRSSAHNKNFRSIRSQDFSGSRWRRGPGLVVVPLHWNFESQGFVELAKSKPAQLNYGPAAIGSSTASRRRLFALRPASNRPVPYTVSATIIATCSAGAPGLVRSDGLT